MLCTCTGRLQALRIEKMKYCSSSVFQWRRLLGTPSTNRVLPVPFFYFYFLTELSFPTWLYTMTRYAHQLHWRSLFWCMALGGSLGGVRNELVLGLHDRGVFGNVKHFTTDEVMRKVATPPTQRDYNSNRSTCIMLNPSRDAEPLLLLHERYARNPMQDTPFPA